MLPSVRLKPRVGAAVLEMAYFMIRVELHHATWQDYDTLHQEMGKEG
jgi:hypothetical protein